MIVGGTEDFVRHIERADGEALAFSAPVWSDGEETRLTLVPFFRVHDSRYVVYFSRSAVEVREADRRGGEADVD